MDCLWKLSRYPDLLTNSKSGQSTLFGCRQANYGEFKLLLPPVTCQRTLVTAKAKVYGKMGNQVSTLRALVSACLEAGQISALAANPMLFADLQSIFVN
jgi:hypothetical protein